MSRTRTLEKALSIQRDFKVDTVVEVIFRAFDYQHIFNVSYDRALDCVRSEYNNRLYYKNK